LFAPSLCVCFVQRECSGSFPDRTLTTASFSLHCRHALGALLSNALRPPPPVQRSCESCGWMVFLDGVCSDRGAVSGHPCWLPLAFQSGRAPFWSRLAWYALSCAASPCNACDFSGTELAAAMLAGRGVWVVSSVQGKGSGVGSDVGPPPVHAWSSRCEMGLSGHAIESPTAAFKAVARHFFWWRTGRPCCNPVADPS